MLLALAGGQCFLYRGENLPLRVKTVPLLGILDRQLERPCLHGLPHEAEQATLPGAGGAKPGTRGAIRFLGHDNGPLPVS